MCHVQVYVSSTLRSGSRLQSHFILLYITHRVRLILLSDSSFSSRASLHKGIIPKQLTDFTFTSNLIHVSFQIQSGFYPVKVGNTGGEQCILHTDALLFHPGGAVQMSPPSMKQQGGSLQHSKGHKSFTVH